MSRSNLGIIERGYIDLVYIHEGAPDTLGRIVDPAHDLGSWYLLSDMQAVIVTGANIPEIDGLEEVYRTLLEAAK